MRINCVNEGNQQPQVRSLEKASSMSLGQKSYDKLNEGFDQNYSESFYNLSASITPISFSTNKTKNMFRYEESTKQETGHDNYCSTENLIGNEIYPKISRESENIHLLKNVNKVMNESKIPNTKSALALITNPITESAETNKSNVLTIKETDNNEIGDLVEKIRLVEIENDKIKEENIQLRMIKLENGSAEMEMIALKLEIQELKRRIERQKFSKFSQTNTKGSLYLNDNEFKNRKMSACSTNSPSKVRLNSIRNKNPQNMSPQMFSSALVQNPLEFEKNCTLQKVHKKEMKYFSPMKLCGENENKEDSMILRKRLMREEDKKREFSPYCLRK